MSPSGQPDFGAKQDTDRSTAVIDPGEQAERINGVGGALYRGGHWIYATGFESGTPAALFGSSTDVGGIWALDNTLAWNGINSLKLITPATSGKLADINKDFPIYPTRMGLEMMFEAALGTNAGKMQTLLFRMVWNRAPELAASSYTAAVQLVYDTNGDIKLQLFEDNGALGAFVDEVNPVYIKNTSGGMFHSIKFVADFTTGLYGPLYLDYLKYDFSNKVMGKSAGAGAKQGQWMTFVARIITNENAAKQMNLDDLVFTADEP